ncbi:MAG: TPM domain-containing protein [Candidatus Moranbacteria bacterium]|nr:TPM domain-containing protein [Candidatus Moranbacteria bacterium]NTW45719.1 TPM domain-containing protein [Candidatus Moranbacteria bacterium]
MKNTLFLSLLLLLVPFPSRDARAASEIPDTLSAHAALDSTAARIPDRISLSLARKRYVFDEAKAFSKSERTRLQSECRHFHEQTGMPIVVFASPSLPDESTLAKASAGHTHIVLLFPETDAHGRKTWFGRLVIVQTVRDNGIADLVIKSFRVKPGSSAAEGALAALATATNAWHMTQEMNKR